MINVNLLREIGILVENHSSRRRNNLSEARPALHYPVSNTRGVANLKQTFEAGGVDGAAIVGMAKSGNNTARELIMQGLEPLIRGTFWHKWITTNKGVSDRRMGDAGGDIKDAWDSFCGLFYMMAFGGTGVHTHAYYDKVNRDEAGGFTGKDVARSSVGFIDELDETMFDGKNAEETFKIISAYAKKLGIMPRLTDVSRMDATNGLTAAYVDKYSDTEYNKDGSRKKIGRIYNTNGSAVTSAEAMIDDAGGAGEAALGSYNSFEDEALDNVGAGEFLTNWEEFTSDDRITKTNSKGVSMGGCFRVVIENLGDPDATINTLSKKAGMNYTTFDQKVKEAVKLLGEYMDPSDLYRAVKDYGPKALARYLPSL